MDTKRMILLRYSLIGAFVGYFIFHPLVMLLSYLMTTKDATLDMTNTVGVIAVALRSFSIDMLPWSLSFTLFNGIIGMYYGILKAEKLAREELIIDLQKALAEVKTLSGLLPICAWCKKIRDDKGYWQKIEAYFKSHSDLDFTHGICNDCAKKQYLISFQNSRKNRKINSYLAEAFKSISYFLELPIRLTILMSR